MTNQQFFDQFQLRIDNVATFAAPGFEPDEVAAIATIAQEALVRRRYGYKGNQFQEGFEETEKRAEDLGDIVRTAILDPLPVSPLNVKNGRFYQLPNTLLIDSNDYSDVHWFTIYSEAIGSKPCKDGSLPRYEVHESEHNRFGTHQNNPFRKPKANRVLRIPRIENNRVELVTFDGTPVQYFLRYVRKPRPVVINGSTLGQQVSELHDHIHMELLDETLLLAMATVANQGTSFQSQNIQRIE